MYITTVGKKDYRQIELKY